MDDLESNEIILDTPDPPDNLPYADFEDYRAEALLKINNIKLTEQSLLSALNHQNSVLKGAAVRVLGLWGDKKNITVLKQFCDTNEDLLKTESAFALVRLGESQYKNVLKQCLNYKLDSHLSPPIAAGNLARLGDPIGFPIIVKCFDIDNLIVKAVACKQLLFFIPFENSNNNYKQGVDVYDLFNKALHDEHSDVQLIALMQLREINSDKSKNLLNDYLLTDAENYLKNIAKKGLNQ